MYTNFVIFDERSVTLADIEIKNLYKDYVPGVHAVQDFNLNINEGEFIVLVGPSGCGESTTLRMIAGLEDVTSGQIYIGGSLVNDTHPKDRDIAMVFQNYALYPHMTVRDNISFGLKMRKVDPKDIQKRVEETASIIGLSDYLDRLPRELSGGQSQRVALGRAISRSPRIFLMDEPLSNLDAKLRVQTRSEISQLAKDLNTTTIYVTHDQVEAMTMADRIVVMDGGIIQQVASPKTTYLYPANKFVASFMGSPAMNFVEARFTRGSLVIGDRIIELDPLISDELAKTHMDRDLILGIRAENISVLDDQTQSRPFVISTRLALVEMLGSESLLHFRLAGGDFICKISSFGDFRPGDDIRLVFDEDYLHFFNIEDGSRIDIPGYGAYKDLLDQGGDHV